MRWERHPPRFTAELAQKTMARKNRQAAILQASTSLSGTHEAANTHGGTARVPSWAVVALAAVTDAHRVTKTVVAEVYGG